MHTHGMLSWAVQGEKCLILMRLLLRCSAGLGEVVLPH